jgi:hypothetical protein
VDRLAEILDVAAENGEPIGQLGADPPIDGAEGAGGSVHIVRDQLIVGAGRS